ncbi:MAG: hypothetical protein AMXMBFR84_11170 [Candidatus Hydrogenedentota bacterium]
MTCKTCEKQIALWVAGDTGKLVSLAIRSHLAQCGHCKQFANELRQSQEMYKAMHTSRIDEADCKELREQVRAAILKETPQKSFRWSPAAQIGWVAVTAFIACGAALYWITQESNVNDAGIESTSQRSIAKYDPVPQERIVPDSDLAPVDAPKSPRTPLKLSQIRLATDDPNVVIILVTDNEGGSS